MTRRKIINNNERYTLKEAAQEFYKHNKTKGLSEAAQTNDYYIDKILYGGKHNMSFDNAAFGNRVKYYRKKRGYSQSYLSELVDKSPPYLSYIENGYRNISIETLVDLANALDVTADELLKDNLNYTAKTIRTEFAAVLYQKIRAEYPLL